MTQEMMFVQTPRGCGRVEAGTAVPMDQRKGVRVRVSLIDPFLRLRHREPLRRQEKKKTKVSKKETKIESEPRPSQCLGLL